jgi:molybdate transport system substrate-binding protein
MPGALVASGRAEIALHQIQELMAVSGIEIVGALPGDLRGSFLFSAAIVTNSARKPAGRRLIELLRSPKAVSLIQAKGMEVPNR